MPAYLISEVEVRDPAGFEAYRSIAACAIAQYGGRYLVRGGAAVAVEGARRRRTLSSPNFPRWKPCANGTPPRNMPKRSSFDARRSTAA
jgi:uncharacterized protein (DUF1330 family)